VLIGQRANLNRLRERSDEAADSDRY